MHNAITKRCLLPIVLMLPLIIIACEDDEEVLDTIGDGIYYSLDDTAGGNLCQPNPCLSANKNVCRLVNDWVACQCNPGFEENPDGECVIPGYYNITPCSPNPCIDPNRSICLVQNGAAVCFCDPGFVENQFGRDCIDPCGGVECSGHGSCVVRLGEAACECDDGFIEAGLRCLLITDASACNPNPCTITNMTVCAEDRNGEAVCLCDPGYVDNGIGGCSLPWRTCEPNPCRELNRNACDASSGVAVCSCNQGYEEDQTGACVAVAP